MELFSIRIQRTFQLVSTFPDEIGFIHCPKRCAERYPIHQRTNFVGLFGHDITQCVLVINYQFDFIHIAVNFTLFFLSLLSVSFSA